MRDFFLTQWPFSLHASSYPFETWYTCLHYPNNRWFESGRCITTYSADSLRKYPILMKLCGCGIIAWYWTTWCSFQGLASQIDMVFAILLINNAGYTHGQFTGCTCLVLPWQKWLVTWLELSDINFDLTWLEKSWSVTWLDLTWGNLTGDLTWLDLAREINDLWLDLTCRWMTCDLTWLAEMWLGNNSGADQHDSHSKDTESNKVILCNFSNSVRLEQSLWMWTSWF